MSNEGDEILAANRMVGFIVLMFFATAIFGTMFVAALIVVNRPDIFIRILANLIGGAR